MHVSFIVTELNDIIMYCFEKSQYASTKINYIALVTIIYFMISVHVRFIIANCTPASVDLNMM